MSATPPPLPHSLTTRRSSNRKLIFTGLLVVLAAPWVFYFFFRYVVSPGFDNTFGDQHLKTAVALIELHKIRYGRYPGSLRELRFRGDWDPIALNSVSYYSNPDRTAYHVEVHRGLLGKPNLQPPPEFWQGTGYSPQLKPPAPEEFLQDP